MDRSKRRICIVTPFHVSMNPRVVKEADALAAAGYTVSVIAPDFSGWAHEADKSYQDRPWKIVAKPTFGPGSGKLQRMVEIARRLFSTIAARGLHIHHPVIVHAALHPVTPLLIKAAMNEKADLYIAHVIAALPAAAIAARHNHALCAYDAEDFHLGEFDDTPKTLFKRQLVELTERRYLPECCYVTASSPLIATAYRDTYGIGLPQVLLNVFPIAHAPHYATLKGSAVPGPSVYWFSQTMGPNRGLECAIRAIGVAKTRPHLYLRGGSSLDYRHQLTNLAKEVGADDRLHFLPLGHPLELERLASVYDIGLSCEPGTTENNKRALGNKLFGYLLAGIPIVASDTPAHRALADTAASPALRLYRTEDPVSLATSIDSLLENPTSLAEIRAAAYALGQRQFNWDLESDRLLQLVNACWGETAVRRNRVANPAQ